MQSVRGLSYPQMTDQCVMQRQPVARAGDVADKDEEHRGVSTWLSPGLIAHEMDSRGAAVLVGGAVESLCVATPECV